MAREQDLQWLTQPPAPGEVRLHVALGEGAQLSPEMHDALERLVRAVQAEQQDVQGFGAALPTPSSPGGLDFSSLKISSLKIQQPLSFSYKFQHKF